MSPPIGSVLASEQETQQANEMKDVLLEMQTASFGHAQTYTTVVIFGGYAGLFGIWSYTRDSLGAGINVWVGLLIGISMLTFVSFEIFGMIIRSIEAFKVRNLLVGQLPPKQFLALHQKLSRESNFTTQKIVIPVWIGALIVSILTGMGAGIILLCSLTSTVFSST